LIFQKKMSLFDFIGFLVSDFFASDEDDTEDDNDKNDQQHKNDDIHFLEKQLQMHGWCDTALSITDSILLDVARNNYNWTEARGFFAEDTNVIHEEDLVEMSCDFGTRRKLKDVIEWQNLLVHHPARFPDNGEIFVVFGDRKSLGRPNTESENFMNLFSKENVLRCNGQECTYISNLINGEKLKHNNYFLLVYRDDDEEHPLTRFTRIACDDRPIAIVWAEELFTFDAKDVEENQKLLATNEMYLLNDNKTFFAKHRFVVFTLSDHNNDKDQRADVIIVNESCTWAKYKNLFLHKIVPIKK
jgi:hypothetical protein